MLQQAGEVTAAEGAQQLAAILLDKSVLAAGARHDRLMQMPAGRKHIRQFRPAHEGGVIAVAPRDLFYRRAEQHHGVGRYQPLCWRKGELALARAVLDLDRSER